MRREHIALFIVLAAAFFLRLYRIGQPLVESHQIRQAQTAMMARNILDDKLDFFHTRLDFFGNNSGHIIIEFPLMHALTALLYVFFGVHEVIGRFVSLLFSVGSVYLFYLLARRFLSGPAVIASTALYAISPLGVFFGRAFMPESSMMFFYVGAVLFSLRWIEKPGFAAFIRAVLFSSIAFLLKPIAGVLFAPVLAAAYMKYRKGVFLRSDIIAYFIISFLPFLAWGWYANLFNAGREYIPYGFGGNWLELVKTRGIVEHWFSARFYKFVGGSVVLFLLTPVGFFGSVWGAFLARGSRYSAELYFWLAATFAYFFALAGITGGHIYYHLPLLPLGAIFFGFSFQEFISFFKRSAPFSQGDRRLFPVLSACFILFCVYLYGYTLFFKYMYSDRMPYTLEAAAVVDKNISKEGFIIEVAPGALSDGVLSYYSRRKTWYYFVISDTGIAELEDLRGRGASAYVAIKTSYGDGVDYTRKKAAFWNHLRDNYKAVAVNDNYAVFDLTVKIKGG